MHNKNKTKQNKTIGIITDSKRRRFRIKNSKIPRRIKLVLPGVIVEMKKVETIDEMRNENIHI